MAVRSLRAHLSVVAGHVYVRRRVGENALISKLREEAQIYEDPS